MYYVTNFLAGVVQSLSKLHARLDSKVYTDARRTERIRRSTDRSEWWRYGSMESRQGEIVTWPGDGFYLYIKHQTSGVSTQAARGRRGRGADSIRFFQGQAASSPEIALRLSNSSATPRLFKVSLAFSRQTSLAVRSASATSATTVGLLGEFV